MMEPDFVAQTDEPISSDERLVWVRAQVEAARAAQGATFFRAALHPDFPNLLLVEGWSKQPDDQGEPRFQMVSGIQS